MIGETLKVSPIKLEINQEPLSGSIDADGDFSFYIYMSNEFDDAFENAIDVLSQVWSIHQTEVSLTINVKLRSVMDAMIVMYAGQEAGEIDAVDAPVFASLRKECQSIIDRIDALKVIS